MRAEPSSPWEPLDMGRPTRGRARPSSPDSRDAHTAATTAAAARHHHHHRSWGSRREEGGGRVRPGREPAAAPLREGRRRDGDGGYR